MDNDESKISKNPKKLGDYLLYKELGKGSYGVVYLAYSIYNYTGNIKTISILILHLKDTSETCIRISSSWKYLYLSIWSTKYL